MPHKLNSRKLQIVLQKDSIVEKYILKISQTYYAVTFLKYQYKKSTANNCFYFDNIYKNKHIINVLYYTRK